MLLVVFALTAAGVPIPAGKATQKNGELFPCATSQCGCASAEQCWSACCCHTLAERLTWAREHGVAPPAFALAEAHSVGFDLSGLAESRFAAATGSPENAPCCTKNAAGKVPSCCQKKPLVVAAADRSCCRKHTKQPAAISATENTDLYIVAWRALSCRGQSLKWLAVVPTVVVARLAWLDQPPCVEWLGPAASDRAVGITDDPSVPPPERA